MTILRQSYERGLFQQISPGAKSGDILAIDAANGIGAQKLLHFRQSLSNLLPIEIFNDGTKGHLNEKVRSKESPSNKKETLVWCGLCEIVSKSTGWIAID